MNRTVAALAGASLVLMLPTRAEAAATISWGTCTDTTLAQGGAECGTSTVPLDHANPSGASITLAVSRVRHTSPDSAYQGVMLTVPNPLGGSGFQSPLIGARLPNHAGDAY